MNADSKHSFWFCLNWLLMDFRPKQPRGERAHDQHHYQEEPEEYQLTSGPFRILAV